MPSLRIRVIDDSKNILYNCYSYGVLWNIVGGYGMLYKERVIYTHNKNTSGMFLSSSHICTQLDIINTGKIQNWPSVAVIDLELESGPLHKQLQYIFDRILG